MLKLNEAIKTKDFNDFYQSVSETWRNDIGLSIKRMERTYQPFIDIGVNLDAVEKADPVFTDPPQINSSGYLMLIGYFPAQVHRITFKLEFTYEMPEWKLFGIDVALVRDVPASQASPSSTP
jgi:hypothetical protein